MPPQGELPTTRIEQAGPASPAAAPLAFAANADGPRTTIRCSRCGAANELGTRFCIACGNPVDPAASKARAAAAAAPAFPAASAPMPAGPPPLPASPPPLPAAPAEPIAPSPVVDLRGSSPAIVVGAPVAAPPAAAPPRLPQQEVQRVCARCRGISEPTAQFCKFCGAPFGDARADRPSSPAVRPGGSAPPPRAVPPAPATTPHLPGQGTPRASNPPPVRSYSPAPLPASTYGPPPGATPMIPPSTETSHFHGAVALAATVKPTGRLVVITKDGGEGTSYPIYEQLDLGRTEGDVVVPEDRYLSPRHARIARRTGPAGEAQLVLRDLGSVNGVFLRIGNAMAGDGRIEAPLRDQDLLLVGQQVLKFEAVKDGEDGLGPASQHGTLLFGTPQSPRFARLLQRTVEGVSREVFYIRKVETVLGRESGDIVFTDDPFLSRRHAVIKFDRDNARFLLADLGSSNGTFIQIHGDVALKSGDQFRIGQQLFRVELSRADA